MFVNLKGIIKLINKIGKKFKEGNILVFYIKNIDYMKGNFKYIALKKNL